MARYHVTHIRNTIWFVFDTLKNVNSSSHDTFESASNRAYILNRFSTGARI